MFFVFLFSFFFYVEGTVAINKDQAKVEGAAERNRKTRSCDNALECLFGLGMLYFIIYNVRFSSPEPKAHR